MKFKIVREKSSNGDYYYSLYEKYWFFFWVYRGGYFHTLKGAEEYVIRTLKEEAEECVIRTLKEEKETPVYYKLEDGVIYYSKNNGSKTGFLPDGERPLKFKKTENEK